MAKVTKVLSDEPDKAVELQAQERAEQARWAFLLWLARLGEAWAAQDWGRFQETRAAVVMLPDGVRVEVRT